MIDRFNIGTIATQMVYRIIETGFKFVLFQMTKTKSKTLKEFNSQIIV